MRIFLMFALIVFALGSLAQDSERSSFAKQIIDSEALSNWATFDHPLLVSPDGNYFTYIIKFGTKRNKFIIQSTRGSWRRELAGSITGDFSMNSKQFIFLKNDTLYLLLLGSDKLDTIPGVQSFSQGETGQWLAYRMKGEEHELILYNLVTGNKQRFVSVEDYSLDVKGEQLLLKVRAKKDGKASSSLQWVELADGKVVTIWCSQRDCMGNADISGYSLDEHRLQVAFIVEENMNGGLVHTLWYYKKGMEKALRKATHETDGMQSEFSICPSSPRFSKDGQYIFFELEARADRRKPNAMLASVDVWNYKDSIVQSKQLVNPGPRLFAAVIGIDKNLVVRLIAEGERVLTTDTWGDFVVIVNEAGDGDRWWLHPLPLYSLVSMKDGRRIIIPTKTPQGDFWICPNGHYLVYFDINTYFSCDLLTGKIVNLSRGANVGFNLQPTGFPKDLISHAVGIGKWYKDSTVLIYDNYDIWRMDLTGKRAPINVTKGYGRKHQIQFRLMSGQLDRLMDNEERLLLAAFDTRNKYSGFFSCRPDGSASPDSLVMGPWVFGGGVDLSMVFDGIRILNKALDANVWIVSRESTSEAINLFLTRDFKTFTPLTNFSPQHSYNWLTAELVNWRQLDGTFCQGILYKPENFNPRKKYPVIFNYYEQLSHRLYQFPRPMYSTDANINIPWFVSRGYLIFTPDIHYQWASKFSKDVVNAKDAYNAVVSAAKHLSTLSFVDSQRMGIAGHSWGGSETNYLVTHTHLFAAALQGSGGSSDLISRSLSVVGIDAGMDKLYEKSIGFTIWQRPDLWIKNSPIFSADQVTSPLLILHCKDDIGWPQSMELFLSLRRQEKPAWLLQYDHGGHSLYPGKDQEDFTMRAMQFFDHYLKKKPAPIWMTKGIPARLKQIENGYDLDTVEYCSKDCEVCKIWNKQYTKHPQMSIKPAVEPHLAADSIQKNKLIIK
ncbi:hypothetical protein A3860_17060 [Niastella vici]|uniref:Peptidase S9 prolyl oligopeptidase catalytic domain-containing protein n=1 Tax=Niastella vici TaxID=1703345 RepID=A0A1V9G4J2_9BACT|nr:prolyl oligopeptidase family serine peptidase [Niastella vici]OQP65376.1 hypothetical protein A3860_17060 [Niastella vici]